MPPSWFYLEGTADEDDEIEIKPTHEGLSISMSDKYNGTSSRVDIPRQTVAESLIKWLNEYLAHTSS